MGVVHQGRDVNKFFVGVTGDVGHCYRRYLRCLEYSVVVVICAVCVGGNGAAGLGVQERRGRGCLLRTHET